VSKRGLPETVRMKHDLHYVEELFHDHPGPVGKYIPIDQIKPNPNQPRQRIGDLTELIASIREKGVLEPLLVRPQGDGYQLIAGERRWRACKELGISMVPCIEKDVDDREMLELALIENLQRKDLSAFEEAEGLQALADRFGYTHSQIAEVMGKSRSSITEVLSLNQIPPEIRELCQQADISSKSLLLQIVRQPDVEEMKKLANRIAQQQTTRAELRGEKKRPVEVTPFTYRYESGDYHLNIRFKSPEVSPERIRAALQDALDHLK
jgi:ParB family chromosome partitioning protein